MSVGRRAMMWRHRAGSKLRTAYLHERLLLGGVPGEGGALERGPEAHGGVGLALRRRARHDLQRARHRVVAQVVARLHTHNTILLDIIVQPQPSNRWLYYIPFN